MVPRIATQYANMLPTFARLGITINRVNEDLVLVTITKLYNDKKWWNNAKAWESLTFGIGAGAVGIGGSFLPENAQKVTEAVAKMFPHFKEVTVTLTEGQIISIEGKLKSQQDFHLQQNMSNDRELQEAVKRMAQQATQEMELRSSIIQATNA